MANNLELEVEQPTVNIDKWEQRFYPNAQLTRLEIELFEQDLNEMWEYLNRAPSRTTTRAGATC